MSAPSGWQKGSFRGVPFVTETQEQTGGRRGVQHEFPQAEKPVWEDLGRKGASFSFELHVRGQDYLPAAQALADALDAKGPGTLIHPWLGSMQVAVPEWTRHDSTTDGGFAAFTVTFLETGLAAVPQPAQDTAALAHAEADEIETAAPASFADKFSLAGVQGFVEEHAVSLVARATSAMAVVSALQGSVAAPLADIAASFAEASGAALTLLRSPVDLGNAIFGAAASIWENADSTASLLGGLIGLLDFGDDLPPIDGATPARDRQRANQAAIVQLVDLAAATTLIRAIADADFASYQEAVALRDAAADALDRLALRQADAGDDNGAQAYDDLRRALVRDVTARGGTLARLQDYTPAVTEPALVIAHRLYGAEAVEARAAELVARNRIAHPGFVQGGIALQVITPESLGGPGA